ncbi:MAG: sugar nucleotide-binding protein, partial [Bacteroidales bacterium]|nr:sugar nucleotide-binding protein [Bacteroidales bacterium]
GCPTCAKDLDVTILDILPKALSSHRLEIFHYSNEGECSWFEFALAAVEMAKISCQVYPVTSGEYPQKAPRPRYSVMDKTKIKEHFGIKIPEWKESLRECLEVLAKGNT